MKILVIGCGSIAQRHIRNLVSLKAGTILAFDVDKRRCEEIKRISSTAITSSVLDLLWKENPQIVFITVPTSLHVQYALEAAKRGCHLFIEKPLSHDLKGIKALQTIVQQKKLTTLVGCNMRFYWAIAKIKHLLAKNAVGRVISARIESGQHLPDWHPWEDYRTMYSARRNLGGGVILDAAHEIDYARWFFGEVEKAISMYGKLSSLKIETEDVAEITLKFKNGPLVNIHMDYIQRDYARSCKIIGEEGTIWWEFSEHSVGLYSANTKKWKIFVEPKNYETNRMYIDEVKYFLKCVQKKIPTFNTVGDGLVVLKIALNAKKKRFMCRRVNGSL